ncbi:MAG: AAA-like domain-containing protein [Spirulina sp.]
MDKIKILFLAADPRDAVRLRLGQELRDIREKLQLSRKRDIFILESRESVRPGDITQAIHDVAPHIIHFSGHGVNTGELCFENLRGETQPIDPDAISNLFSLVVKQVQCVILNACYSEMQANAISEHIPHVIGMSQAIGDKAAISFSIGFYKALGAGCTFEEAYKFGCVEIQLENLPENLIPVFHTKKESVDDIYYIERPPIEDICYKMVLKPTCLIKIQGCHQMGKTLLMHRIFSYSESKGYKKIYLNLQLLEQNIVSDLGLFLKWLCINASQQLNLPNRLDEYWDEDIGAITNTSLYFEDYLLNCINAPIILGIDELGRLYENESILVAFLPLLRSWYEESKMIKSWKKLRIIVTYHKSIYMKTGLNLSPFNIGFPINLSEFILNQAHNLVQRHELSLTINETEKLMSLVGGHPWRIQHALEQIKYQGITLEQLLDIASTDAGIYGHHLQQIFLELQDRPKYLETLRVVINSPDISPKKIDFLVLNDLMGLGLVRIQGEGVIPSCKLYAQYFLNRMAD